MPGSVPGVGGFGAPPATPPACQQLLALRDETHKYGFAIQKANEHKAPVHEACRLFRSYLSAEARFIKSLEENGRACGMPSDRINQVKESHAKASQVGKQVCDLAAQTPWPADPIPWGALLADAQKPRTGSRPMRTDPWDALQPSEASTIRDHEENCNLCGKMGDSGG